MISYNPATGKPIASYRTGTADDYRATVAEMDKVRAARPVSANEHQPMASR